MATDPMAKAARRVVKLGLSLGLPDVTEGVSFGTPALLVRGKSITRIKDADTLVLMMSLEQKEMLTELAPEIYFETDHYKGWPAVLIRLGAIGDKELKVRITEAWRRKAPKRVLAAWDAQHPSKG